MKQVLYLTFVLWFFLPTPAHAYLDPGTGNALVYVVVSFFGALLFSLKGLFYKLLGKNDALADEHADRAKWHKIVIFSEGKIYWGTFRPIVEELIRREVPFSYYTLDIGDPCLTISHPNVNNRYVGNGNRAFAKLGHLRAEVVLSTTPNIGTPGYPIPRSADIKKLVYVFHAALDDMAFHHRHSLDCYDAVLLMGAFQEPIIRKVEQLRSLPPKEVYPAGLPYMDILSKKQVAQAATNRTVLFAPSWGVSSCLRRYGSQTVANLAKAGFNVILRPHPYSWQVEPDFLATVKQELAAYSNVIWDTAVDSTESMQKAALMVSDVSGVRVDFLLLQQKPVITLAMPMDDAGDLEIIDLKESWTERELKKFTRTLGQEEIGRIAQVADELINSPSNKDIAAFREENIYNWGQSAPAVVDFLLKLGG